jgi:nicotinate-nucleotide adenylyltransferase
MRTLWYGGSFNPIHLGHLICARSVAESAGFDRVVLVPSSQPPHKSADTGIAAAEDRLAMCRLAVANDPLFEVDNIEMRRSGPSYTLDTARQLKTFGHAEISWLIGADMALHLPRWHQPAKLLAEVNFVLMARPGWELDWKTLPPEFHHLELKVVKAPLVEISSTQIRDRLGKGLSIRYLTPDTVIDYIHTNKLYTGVVASAATAVR